MSLRILLADDHVLVRESLKVLLQNQGFAVVAEASDGAEAVRLARETSPRVAVLDLAMPVLNGIDASREILAASPRTRVILLTMHSEDHYVVEALRAGIVGYVLKTRAAAALVRAVSEVDSGNVYLSPGVSRSVVQEMLNRKGGPPDVLSPRERQAIQLIAEGRTTKEVAVQLGISVKSAESHRARIMEKLDIHETAGLVRYAIRRGIIQP